MTFTVLIPARLKSTRLPDKPLADIHGAPMVVRVAQRAARSQAARVAVAADDARIVEACRAHGVQALLTRTDHLSGSDRLAEACEQLQLDGDAIVINVQGDEPLIAPAMIDACAALLRSRSDCVMATVAHAISDAAEFANPNVVKVVCDAMGRALYFSRAPIPHWRDAGAPNFDSRDAGAPLRDSRDRPSAEPLSTPPPLRHVGLYAYRAAFLRRFPTLPPAPLEALESLEQLRVLWHGERVAVHLSAERPGPGVDTPADLQRVRELWPRG